MEAESNQENENKVKARLLSQVGPREIELPNTPQREYRPTSYRDSNWELVGGYSEQRHFLPLDPEVIAQEEFKTDPMFDVFDEPEKVSRVGAGAQAVSENSASEESLRKIESEWQQRLEQAVASAYEKGKSETEQLFQAEHEKLRAQAQEFLNECGEEWRQLAEKLEKNALQLSLQVAKRILTTTAEIKPDYILQVIRQGLASLGAAKPIRIRVSAEDFEFLTVVGIPVELSAQELGVSYVSDENIRSGCVIETDFGELDLELEQMWSQVKDSLYELSK